MNVAWCPDPPVQVFAFGVLINELFVSRVAQGFALTVANPSTIRDFPVIVFV